MEEPSSEPIPEHCPDLAITIQRMNLEDLVGQVVCQEMASQQVGLSFKPTEEGEHLEIVIGSPPARPSLRRGEQASAPSHLSLTDATSSREVRLVHTG